MPHSNGDDRPADRATSVDVDASWENRFDRKRVRRALAESAVPLAISVSIIVGCLITSHKKALWTDEVWSLTFLRESSLAQLLRNLAVPADSAQPLYYTLGWIWSRIAGASDTSFRLFSALWIVAGVWMLWLTLRRAYPYLAAATGLLLAVCSSDLLLYHASEIRFYGLLTGLVAFAYFVYARVATTDRPTMKDLALQVVASSALVFCHITGWFYSAAFLVAYLFIDWRRGLFRPRVYAAVLLGWATYAAWLPAFIRQAGLAKPHSNLRPPSFTDIISIYQFEAKLLPILLLILVSMVALTRADTGDSSHSAGAVRFRNPARDLASDRAAVFLGGLAILAVPAVVFVASRLVVPMLLPRYVIPSVLGVAVLLAELMVLIGKSRLPSAMPARIGWCAFLGAVAMYPIIRAKVAPPTQTPGRAQILRLVPPSVPVVVDEAYYSAPLNYRHALGDRLVYYLLDWESAMDPADSWDVASNDRFLSIWSRLGYAQNVLTVPEFVCTHDRWVLVHTPGFVMFERRIASDSAFNTTTIGFTEGHPMIQVERKPGHIPMVCESSGNHQWLPPNGPGSANQPRSNADRTPAGDAR